MERLVGGSQSRGLAWMARPELDAQAAKAAPASTPVSSSSSVTATPGVNLQRSVRRIEGATRLVGQLSDLVAGVRQGVLANQDRPEAMEAGQRLLASAASTAADMVKHAQVDGQPLLAGPSRTGVSAYISAQSAFRAANGGDSTEAATALVNAREVINGPGGVVPKLREMAEMGPTEGQNAVQRLDQMDENLRKLQERLREVNASLTNLGVPAAGATLDLSA